MSPPLVAAFSPVARSVCERHEHMRQSMRATPTQLPPGLLLFCMLWKAPESLPTALECASARSRYAKGNHKQQRASRASVCMPLAQRLSSHAVQAPWTAPLHGIEH